MIACRWCRKLFEPSRPGELSCGRKCRQAVWRLRQRFGVVAAGEGEKPLRFCYADPPYPGRSFYYKKEKTYGGEVDHRELVASLTAAGYAGWALSTGAHALREVLPLVPEDHRVMAWVKPIGVSSRTRGPHNAWEPLIVVGGRRLRPGKRDWLAAQPARFEGSLMGRKPIAFCAFLFGMLGMRPGDELVDLFPGTGIVSRAWRELQGLEASPAPRGPGDVLVTPADLEGLDAYPLFRRGR